ncbi:MAG: L,D-transpeptidase family protein [Gammaproteobacteria bacterium]
MIRLHLTTRTLLPCVLLMWPFIPAQAQTFLLPPADVDVVGRVEYSVAGRDDTLLDIARRYDIGQNEILLANPDVDRWLPADNSKVRLPNRYIIPGAERSGVILNLPEMRLYYFPKPKQGLPPQMITHPISVGRMDWKTPLGNTRIASKQKNPTWTPPASIKEEALADGKVLPDVIPAGPDNPLGLYAMRLGIPGYLIHSTNKPYGVGMRVTHGCIRMYPEDIEGLFADIPVGTPVHIVNQPIKLGWMAGGLFVELHPPLDEDLPEYENYLQRVLDAVADMIAAHPELSALNNEHRLSLNGAALRKAVEEQSGIPVLITR